MGVTLVPRRVRASKGFDLEMKFDRDTGQLTLKSDLLADNKRVSIDVNGQSYQASFDGNTAVLKFEVSDPEVLYKVSVSGNGLQKPQNTVIYY